MCAHPERLDPMARLYREQSACGMILRHRPSRGLVSIQSAARGKE